MSQKWNENMNLVESIIRENINEQNIPIYTHSNIISYFNSVKQYYTKNRFDYKNYDDLNREILYTLNTYIQDIKRNNAVNQVKNTITEIKDPVQKMSLTPAGEDQGRMAYLSEHRKNMRLEQFEVKLKEAQESFNNNVVKRPDEIDFSDKPDEDQQKY